MKSISVSVSILLGAILLTFLFVQGGFPIQVVNAASETTELTPPAQNGYFPNPAFEQEDFQTSSYPFSNPAGCAVAAPTELSSATMLANVQAALGDKYDLSNRRQTQVWNGPLGTMLNVAQDEYVFEFEFNEFQPPFTFQGDQVATTFLVNGFAIWFRSYDGSFRLMALPLVPGVLTSQWNPYVTTYWQVNGQPVDDKIYPVIKKLPCHWVIDQGYANRDTLLKMFDLDWKIPEYIVAGRQYLSQDCDDAQRISRELIGYGDATSMCGPLTWQITKDANGFPYRIGSWNADYNAFVDSNPVWNGQPWGSFDPETFDLVQYDQSIQGYDFSRYGNLYPGDMVFSYGNMVANDAYFAHIYTVATIRPDQGRISVTNMVKTNDCSISEVVLYVPGNTEIGVINHEWNGFDYGFTGTTGFDIFRWKWITYHIEGIPVQYTVRWGDTLETIAFDWKISPDAVLIANNFQAPIQFTPGQIITLPSSQPFDIDSSIPEGNGILAGK